jgi:hypothetical protein
MLRFLRARVRLVVALATALAIVVVAPTRARADGTYGATWGITTAEALLPGELVILLHEPGVRSNATGGQKAVYIGTTLVILAIPTTIGLVADANRWDTTVPRAVHLGMWTGASALMVGAALSANHDDDALVPRGALPLVLGGAGFVAGALFGATQVETGSDREFGLLGTGLMVAIAGGVPTLVDTVANAAFVDGTTIARHARRDLAIGMTAGLAAGYATMLLLPNAGAHVSAAPIAGGALLSWAATF